MKKNREELENEIAMLKDKYNELFRSWEYQSERLLDAFKEITALTEELERYKKLYLNQLEQSLNLAEKLERK